MEHGGVPLWVRRTPVISGVVATVLASCALIGGMLGADFLTRLSQDLPSIRATTCVAFVAAGVSLALVDGTSRSRVISRVLACIPGLIGAVTGIEWIFGMSFGIDRMLPDGRSVDGFSGRPSTVTAAALLTLAIVLVTTDTTRATVRRFNVLLTFAFVTFVGAASLGYLYGADVFSDASRRTGVSLVSLIIMLAFSAGVLGLVARRPVISWVWGDTSAGALVRRLVPVCVAAPTALGFMRLLGQNAGWYDTKLGLTLNTGSIIVVLGLIIAITGRAVHRTEVRGAEASQQLAAIFDNVPASMAMRDQQGRFIRANAAVARARGVEARDMVGRPVSDFYPSEVAADFQVEDDHVYETREAIRFGYSVPNADGEEQDFEVTRFPVFGKDGDLMGVGTFAIEVTDRKRAEHKAMVEASRFRALLDAAPDATVIVDARGFIAYSNARTSEMLGYSTDELVGQPVEILVPDAARSRHIALRDGYIEAPAFRSMATTMDLEARHKDGRLIPVEVSLGPLETEDGVMTSAAIRDVAAKRQAADSLRAAEQLFRSSFDDAPIGMALVAMDGSIEQANPALGLLVGLDRADLIGTQLSDLVHESDRETLRTGLDAPVSGGSDRLSLDLRMRGAERETANADVHVRVLRDPDGNPKRLLVQIQDVTERRQFEAQLQFMADHDPLTGLYNRRKFEAELADHVARVKRYGPEGAIIALDIDHFKQVNDTLGHNVGDQLIIAMAGILRGRLRESDVIARLGGDEFAILLPKADRAGAAHVAASIVEAVRTSTHLLAVAARSITTSAGVAMFEGLPTQDMTGEGVLIAADVALYDAKAAGRDTYMFHDVATTAPSPSQSAPTWTSRIETALDEGRFTLLAQPVLDLHTQRADHYELFVRMLDESGDQIPPGSFLGLAERHHLASRIDEWVFTRAADLVEQVPGIRVEMNVSAASIGDRRFLEHVSRRLASLPQSGHGRMIFDITEADTLTHVTRVQQFAQFLHERGCALAVDDFGAGLGSFYYLKHLPFDYIRIDGEFVAHADTNPADRLVISSVVQFAHGLGKRTIAEFVTNDNTRRLMETLGVDHVQGYGVGFPVPVDELTDKLNRALGG